MRNNRFINVSNQQSGVFMSDEQQSAVEESAAASAVDSGDSKADATAIMVIFSAAVLFCVFYISGWSFDL